MAAKPDLPRAATAAARMASRPRLFGATPFRLIAVVVAAFVLIAAGVFAILFRQTNAMLTAQVVQSLELERGRFLEVARRSGDAALAALIEDRAAPARPGGQLTIIVDDAGTKVAGNLERWPPELARKPQGGAFVYEGTAPAVGIPTPLPGGGLLLVARDLREQSALLDRMRWLFLIGFGLLSLLALAAGLGASRLMLRRIAQVTDASAEIMAGDLSRRVPLTGSDDEFDHLAGHLNAMLARIEQLMMAMREVSDNVAHDLKTPLSRLRNRAEEALRAPPGTPTRENGLSGVIEDADAIIRTFNALLLIARLEAGAVEESAEQFDLAQLVDDVADLYRPVAEEAGQQLHLDLQAPLKLRANRQLISQAIANLIDNAIKYGVPSKATVPRIDVSLQQEGGEAVIAVADRGPGIPLSDRERVAKRFVRLDQSRSRPGTGLGLSLVAAVARLHHGRMLIEDNAPGLRIVIRLPVLGIDRGST